MAAGTAKLLAQMVSDALGCTEYGKGVITVLMDGIFFTVLSPPCCHANDNR